MTTVPTPYQINATALRLLGEIAPEADVSSLDPDVSFRDQLDIDSMDFLNFVIALHETLHIDIPEADYPKLNSLNACVKYLPALLAARSEHPR
jgi:acyl carrier protein